MGAKEDAERWKQKQSFPENYDVREPITLYTLDSVPKNTVRVFMEEGDGKIWLGNNPYNAADGAQEHKVDKLGCLGEGDVCLVCVVKKT